MIIPKTYKLFIGGAFPRSESGRSLPASDRKGATRAHLCRASRKDLRDAVEAARTAQPRWAALSAYNRAQILYRMAEMLDARRGEFEAILRDGPGVAEELSRRRAGAGRAAGSRSPAPRAPRGAARGLSPAVEVGATLDRLVSFAGWADKQAEVLGRRAAVSGPWHVFSLPEPCGVVAAVSPDHPALLGLVSQMAAALSAGNAVVCLASERDPLPAALFAEVLSTSDLPGGAVNILTGERAELLPHLAGHREIRAILAADLPEDQARQLREGASENLKRVQVAPRGLPEAWLDHDAETSPARLEAVVEIKTIWHPSAP